MAGVNAGSQSYYTSGPQETEGAKCRDLGTKGRGTSEESDFTRRRRLTVDFRMTVADFRMTVAGDTVAAMAMDVRHRMAADDEPRGRRTNGQIEMAFGCQRQL